MIKTVGYFKDYEDRSILVVPLGKKDFDKFVDHVSKNMFFAYRIVNERFKEILLVSIGDHLDTHDIQNLIKADICVQTVVKGDLTKETTARLEDNASWYIFLSCEPESLIFSIDKETQFIKSRAYYKENNAK